MNSIYRSITVTREPIVEKIKVTKGTNMIPIVLSIVDFNIPVTASATACVTDPSEQEGRTKLCSISGNKITLEPTSTMFNVGRNTMVVSIINDKQILKTFEITVECNETKDGGQESVEPPQTIYQQILAEYGNMSGRLETEMAERINADNSEKSEREKADSTERSERTQEDAKLKNEIEVERQRVNMFTTLKEGSTTGDAELADIRIGADGKKYDNAGDAVRGQIGELKSDLGDISIITLSTLGYIKTSTSVINLTPVSNNSYRCTILDCVEGDLFTVTSTSGEGSLPYVFIDADNNALQKCKVSSVTNLFIRAPKNTSKVVFNTGSIQYVKIYHGWKNILKSLSYLDSNEEETKIMLSELSQSVDADKWNAELEKLTHVRNDLLTDGISGMPNCIISLNGDVSDAHYGKDGAVYRFTVPEFKKTYVAFDFKWLNVLPYVSDSDKYPFAKVYGALNQPCIYPRNSHCNNGTMYRITIYGAINSYLADYSNVFGWNQFKTNNGKNALWVEYTGERTGSDDNAEIQFTANSVILKRNGTSFATLEYSVNDSVQSLIDALNSVENINAKAINAAGHTIAELLPVVLNGCFSFGCSYTNSSGTKIYDFCKVNIPYALDDEWHTCEVVFDPSTNTSYVSIDGNTLKTNVSSSRYVDAYKYISVGATDIKVKNLIIDYGSFGDAEVVTSVAYPTEGIPQLVSNRSPRVIVFEGHGVEAVSDDTELSDDMNCTTDRLLSLFEKLNNAGYKPITWEQYKAWKINGVGNLPKRSYLMMFDDYRYENYMIIANRIPFTKFDVKPALAVITGLKEPTENITADGKTYSVRDIWDLIVKAGWYPCSHTYNHRIISKYSPSELDTLFKVDVQSCDNIGIYSDIIVYPTGAIEKCDYAVLERSNFALGVNIVTQRYNCKATNNYYISRVDIGSRNTIEQLYSAIV